MSLKFRPHLFSFVLFPALVGCRGQTDEGPPCDKLARAGDVVINELVAKNDGVWIDETGATDDYVEVVNRSERIIRLSDFELRDGGARGRLPRTLLEPGDRKLIWADDEEKQGSNHLPFKLSSSGETVILVSCEAIVDEVRYPELAANESYSRFPDADGDFAVCRYATPTKDNGDVCRAPTPDGLETEVTFADFEWPGAHPELPAGLALSELHLRPAEGEEAFVEIENLGEDDFDLSDHRLTLAAVVPGEPYPTRGEGELVGLDALDDLKPGERLVIPLTEDQLAPLVDSPAFEGVVTLFGASTDEVADRVDFMRWPEGVSLARPSDEPERLVFCQEVTPGEENDCTLVAERNVGDRVRALRTRADFERLAEGGATLNTSAVKFVVDVEQDDAVHLLRAEDWALHYTFIREVIEGEDPLDRCDSEERAEFNQGWVDFSAIEYFSTMGRSFYLGTFVKHGATGHQTVEHALGDVILPEDIRRTFFAATARVLQPELWAMRPQNGSQVVRVRQVEGTLSLLPTNAPFAELSYQPLTHGVGYGVLTFVAADELHSTPLGAQAILVTDDVPNDIPLVGGLITQAFQTPLAHVNVLSQNRGTPNMALRDAVEHELIQEHLGELVRLEVAGDRFSIEEADPEEAAEFWEDFAPSGPQQAPRLDVGPRKLVDLADADLDDLPTIGAKAAQVGELYDVSGELPSICAGLPRFRAPEEAFAVPVVHFVEHFEDSEAKELFEELRETDAFLNDPVARAESLSEVQERIVRHPVDAELLADLENEIAERFGNRRVRLRSSSNAEDLPGFNGAGLYTSASAELDDPQRSVADALRIVWASLFNSRAYDERELARVDHDEVAMGVLIHEAFTEEATNGVGVSRNVLDPIRGDIYYLNTQAGEASVTNPAPGIVTEALEFQWPPRTPLETFVSTSSFTGGEPVMSTTETAAVACALRAIHDHFQPKLDPEDDDPWFAMEVEFKLLQPSRTLVVKQARPHAFGGFDIVTDCREF